MGIFPRNPSGTFPVSDVQLYAAGRVDALVGSRFKPGAEYVDLELAARGHVVGGLVEGVDGRIGEADIAQFAHAVTHAGFVKVKGAPRFTRFSRGRLLGGAEEGDHRAPQAPENEHDHDDVNEDITSLPGRMLIGKDLSSAVIQLVLKQEFILNVSTGSSWERYHGTRINLHLKRCAQIVQAEGHLDETDFIASIP